MSTITSHSPLNISETVREYSLGSKRPAIGNGIWGINWSHDRWRFVNPKCQTRTPICLEPNISKTAGENI